MGRPVGAGETPTRVEVVRELGGEGITPTSGASTAGRRLLVFSGASSSATFSFSGPLEATVS